MPDGPVYFTNYLSISQTIDRLGRSTTVSGLSQRRVLKKIKNPAVLWAEKCFVDARGWRRIGKLDWRLQKGNGHSNNCLL